MSNTDPFSVKPVEIARYPEAKTGSGPSGTVRIAGIPVAPVAPANPIPTEVAGLAQARAIIGNQPPSDPIQKFREAVGGDPLQK